MPRHALHSAALQIDGSDRWLSGLPPDLAVCGAVVTDSVSLIVLLLKLCSVASFSPLNPATFPVACIPVPDAGMFPARRHLRLRIDVVDVFIG